MIVSQSKVSYLIYLFLSFSVLLSIVVTPIFNYLSIFLIIIFFTSTSAIFVPGFFILFVILFLTFIGSDYDFLFHSIIFSLGVIFIVKKNLDLKYINFSIVVLMIYYFKFYDTSDLIASYNVVSATLSVFFILEFLFRGRISRIHIASILLIFLLLGNRSSIFLLICYINHPLFYILSSLLIIPIFFFYEQVIFLTNFIFLTFFQRVYDDGNAMPEMRSLYIYEFFQNFSHILAGKFQSFYIPYTSDGSTHDAHNSFLTNILRDQHIGLFKSLCWFVCLFCMPVGLFFGITIRACFDSYLIGGVFELIMMICVSTCLHRKFTVKCVV